MPHTAPQTAPESGASPEKEKPSESGELVRDIEDLEAELDDARTAFSAIAETLAPALADASSEIGCLHNDEGIEKALQAATDDATRELEYAGEEDIADSLGSAAQDAIRALSDTREAVSTMEQAMNSMIDALEESLPNLPWRKALRAWRTLDSQVALQARLLYSMPRKAISHIPPVDMKRLVRHARHDNSVRADLIRFVWRGGTGTSEDGAIMQMIAETVPLQALEIFERLPRMMKRCTNDVLAPLVGSSDAAIRLRAIALSPGFATAPAPAAELSSPSKKAHPSRHSRTA